MELFNVDGKVYNVLGKGKMLFALSIIAFFLAVAVIFYKGLAWGIDFSGGTVVQIQYHKNVSIEDVRERLAQNEIFKHASITEFGNGEIMIRSPIAQAAIQNDISDELRKSLQQTGDFEIRKIDMVGPKAGDDLRMKGLTAFILALFVILISVTLRYELRFAIAGVVALLHDIVITIGAIAFFKVDVNIETIAAILTILGYSIHDTIIVFDRVREFIKESKTTDFREIINEAVTKTLSRTVLTSLVVFFVILTLFVFGGDNMKGFSFPMLIGVLVGSYSSVFVAAQLVIWTGFRVDIYRAKQAEKLKNEQAKARMRAMYENGQV